MTLNDILDYTRTYIRQPDETVIEDGFILELAKDSVNAAQENFIEYCYPTAFKTIYGEGYLFGYPSDSKDSMVSEMVAKAGSGVVFTGEVLTSANGSIIFTGLEPKEEVWTIKFVVVGNISYATIIPKIKTIEIGYHFDPTGDEPIATTNAQIVTLLNASDYFNEYFSSITTNGVTQAMMEGLDDEPAGIPITGGSGAGFRKCNYLPQVELNSTITDTLTMPRTDLAYYYTIRKLTNGIKMIEFLPPTVTHFLIQYIQQITLPTKDTTIPLPVGLDTIIKIDVLMKVYDSFMNRETSKELKEEYALHYRNLKSQYQDYVGRLTVPAASKSTPIKNR